MTAKQTIEEALHCLLIDNGYEKTTYQQVAELSGYTRALVQHHLPSKKDFAASFYSRMLNLTVEYLSKHGIERDSAGLMAFGHYAGQISIAFMQMDEDLRRLTAEILEYRSVGKLFTDIQRDWSGKWTLDIKPNANPMEFDGYAYCNGGVFQCLYEAASENRCIDPGLASKALIRSAFENSGLNVDHFEETIGVFALSDETISEGCRHIRTTMEHFELPTEES